MANIDVPNINAIQFPEEPVYVGTPYDFYTKIVVPQTRFDLSRAYLLGAITSGGAINIDDINRDIGRVIQENLTFGVAFWKALLSSDIPLYLADVGDLRDAQVFSPHAINRCALPDPTGSESKQYWNEMHFYIMQFAWIFGLKPDLFTDFAAMTVENVDLALLKNDAADLEKRKQETHKIVANMERFFKGAGHNLQPIDAMIALPKPEKNDTQSIGSRLELKVSQTFAIPSYQAVIHPEAFGTDPQFQSVRNTLVGWWMLDRLLNTKDLPPSNGRSVSLQPSQN